MPLTSTGRVKNPLGKEATRTVERVDEFGQHPHAGRYIQQQQYKPGVE
jgi:hypothetical protein